MNEEGDDEGWSGAGFGRFFAATLLLKYGMLGETLYVHRAAKAMA
jgi:hypothetical protein